MERTPPPLPPPPPPHAPPLTQEQDPAAPQNEGARRKAGRRPDPAAPLKVYRVDPRGFRSLVQRLTGSTSHPPRAPPQTSTAAAPPYSNARPSSAPQHIMAADVVQGAPGEYFSANVHNINDASSSHGEGVHVGLAEAGVPATAAADSGGAPDQLWSPMLYSGYNWEYLWNSCSHPATNGHDSNK